MTFSFFALQDSEFDQETNLHGLLSALMDLVINGHPVPISSVLTTYFSFVHYRKGVSWLESQFTAQESQFTAQASKYLNQKQTEDFLLICEAYFVTAALWVRDGTLPPDGHEFVHKFFLDNRFREILTTIILESMVKMPAIFAFLTMHEMVVNSCVANIVSSQPNRTQNSIILTRAAAAPSDLVH